MEDNVDLCVGIDPASRKMAIVTEVGGVRTFDMVTTKSSVLAERLSHLADGVAQVIQKHIYDDDGLVAVRNVVVYIEEPMLGPNARSTIVQSLAQGAVLSALWDVFAADVFQVNNKTWKKDIVGKGNASKEDIAQWVSDNHPDVYALVSDNQDLLDAFCISLYAREKHDLGERIRQSLSGIDVA